MIRVVQKAMVVFMALICIGLVLSYINHSIQLKNESRLLKPLGEMVEIDGARMSIYVEGEGEKTLVFLSGSGTASPILDFRSLYSQLSEEYQIVVIERFGYGFSDITNRNRDVDTVLEDSRTALEKVGIQGPFVLIPHSMSGIEALHWAQKYPTEVAAIIGLDMSTPESYEDLKMSIPLMRLLQFGANVGITRLGSLSESTAIQNGLLTEEEKSIYRAVFYSRTMTNDMLNETIDIKAGAEKVGNTELPKVPILLFSSDGSGGTGFEKEEWFELQESFADKIGAKLIHLQCGHYVHDYEFIRIAKEIKLFLDQ